MTACRRRTPLPLLSLALVATYIAIARPGFSAQPPAPPTSKTIPVAGHGDLVLNVPDGWDLSYQRTANAGPPTIFARKLGSKETGITITVLPGERRGAPIPADKARSTLEARANALLPKIKETALEYKDLKGDEATGCYCLITYRKAEKGKGVHATLATVAVGDLLLGCDVAQNYATGPYQKAALEMLRSATQKPVTGNPTSSPTTRPRK